MKIRNGFVSNSSTSSFLIYGIKLNPEMIKEINTELFTTDELNELLNIESYDDLDCWAESMELITGKCEYANLFHYNPYELSLYLGSSWDKVQDDETGLQFKSKIKKDILSIWPNLDDNRFITIKKAWRNG